MKKTEGQGGRHFVPTKEIIVMVLLSISFAVVARAASPTLGQEVMEGKIDTGRTIHLETVLPCPRDEVFTLWTEPEGIASFFAPRSNVNLRVGGQYEMIFAPDFDPEGANYGTKGARVLRVEKDRRLWFEWVTFVTSKHPSISGPPVVSQKQRDVRPLPTWLELEFSDISDQPGATHLRLLHLGFRSGAPWDEALPYFWQQWGAVLGRLGSVCSTAPE